MCLQCFFCSPHHYSDSISFALFGEYPRDTLFAYVTQTWNSGLSTLFTNNIKTSEAQFPLLDMYIASTNVRLTSHSMLPLPTYPAVMVTWWNENCVCMHNYMTCTLYYHLGDGIVQVCVSIPRNID